MIEEDKGGDVTESVRSTPTARTLTNYQPRWDLSQSSMMWVGEAKIREAQGCRHRRRRRPEIEVKVVFKRSVARFLGASVSSSRATRDRREGPESRTENTGAWRADVSALHHPQSMLQCTLYVPMSGTKMKRSDEVGPSDPQGLNIYRINLPLGRT